MTPVTFCIGAPPTVAHSVFGQLAHVLREEYPTTRLRFVERCSDELHDLLGVGEVDLALVYRSRQEDVLASSPLLYERMWVISAAGSRIKLSSLRPELLGELRLVMPTVGDDTRGLLESLATKYRFESNIVLESDASITVLKQIICDGTVSTLLPLAAVLKDVQEGKLHAARLEHPVVERCIALACSKQEARLAALQHVGDLIKHTVLDLARSGRWPGVAVRPTQAGNDDTHPILRQTPLGFKC